MAEGGVEEKEVRPACVVREKNQWNWKVVTAEEPDVDPTIVEKSVVRHVVNDFTNDDDEQLSPQSTISSILSDFQEADDLFMEFDDVGSSTLGDTSGDINTPRTWS
ncbi:uncharacterized protein E5676_scaffold234G00070 [Cucumis melo var. makuwa]|uniref:Uncharacterized protein n=1 Tax=Cucumis melo var. makuwa TaxID=1194695 RepID=A0A5D3BFU4_CUCMM|nr:uncharacterized protein E5676_scaffold234G00070 [Cucumis melo var. makuwa]